MHARSVVKSPERGAAERRPAELEASEALEAALAQVHTLHLPGARALHRQRLERVLTLTGQLLESEVDDDVLQRLGRLRIRAQAARANDARHGAGQLSRSAQRAPTSEDCEQGWQKVESIVRGAEQAASDAEELAASLDDVGATEAALAAASAAKAARQIVEQRNHAYTFHADRSFSFGEGWYVAAAGLLADVTIQVEPDQAQSAQAERFLSDAGLTEQLVPYRSRPRANKALPALIASAFRHDAEHAQAKLRSAFLGSAPIASEITQWVDEALADVSASQKKVLIWVRDGVHGPHRNSTRAEIEDLCRLAHECGLLPLLFGDAIEAPPGCVDLTLCWRLPLFQGIQMRRAQLQLFEYLQRAYRLVGQVGVTTAGMDGPALLGLPTMYITAEPNPRLGRWVGAVPGYEEVVRDAGCLRRIGTTLAEWAG